MPVPGPSNPIWSQVILGKKRVEFESLAIKVFLGRARGELSRNPAAAAQLAGELHAVVVSNEALPTVQRDLSKLCV